MDPLEMARDKPITLDLKDISEVPGPYCMSFGFDLQPLIRSIQACGLINKPFLVKNMKGRVDLVAGYRRILALKSLKWEKVPCRDISDSGMSPLQLLLFNLHDNLATRRFNDVEKGMVLNRLIPHVPKEEIAADYMPLLNLSSHEPTLHVFSKLEEMDRPMKEALVQGRISFQTIKALMETDPDSRSTLFEWISNIGFNSNQQAQVIEYTKDISIRERKGISELLGERQLSSIREDENLNNPQKARLVIDLLRSRRFPSLSRSEKDFKKKVSSLGLPEGVRISHPPFFEGPDYRLEIIFKDGKQLKERINALSERNDLETLNDPWKEEDM